jgi:hypothetical protein
VSIIAQEKPKYNTEKKSRKGFAQLLATLIIRFGIKIKCARIKPMIQIKFQLAVLTLFTVACGASELPTATPDYPVLSEGAPETRPKNNRINVGFSSLLQE